MGTIITPTYRVEVTDSRRTPQGIKRQTTQMVWRGRANTPALETWIMGYAKSLEHNGVNAHISKTLGYIPYPNKARIVRQRTDEVVAEWTAAPFQVF